MYKVKVSTKKKLWSAFILLIIILIYILTYRKIEPVFTHTSGRYYPQERVSSFRVLGKTLPAENFVGDVFKKKVSKINATIVSYGNFSSKLLRFDIYTKKRQISSENILYLTQAIRESRSYLSERNIAIFFKKTTTENTSTGDIYCITYTSNQNDSTPLITRIESFWSWVKHPQYFFSIYYAKN